MNATDSAPQASPALIAKRRPGRPILLDLTGHRSGRLLVTGRAKLPDGKAGVSWHVTCDCGSEKIVSGGNLRDGVTKSCGCLRRELMQSKERPRVTPADFTGQSFGPNFVVGLASEAPRKWLVRCKCGLERINSVGSLHKPCRECQAKARIGISRINLIGKTFSRLTVIGREYPDKKGVWWNCSCNCGNTKIADTYSLTGLRLHSCGCAVVNRDIFNSIDRRIKKGEAVKAKIKSCPKFRLDRLIRRRLLMSLRSINVKKTARWDRLVGYSLDELSEHLLNTIPDGYTEYDANSGLLHIDHWKPLRLFSYQSVDDPQFKEAWALRNLRYLPAADNLKKGGRFTAEMEATYQRG